MNTIDTARDYLNREGYTFETLTGHGYSGDWEALVLSYGTTDSLRIWSDDVEAGLIVSMADGFGFPKGEALRVTGTATDLIEGTISVALSILMNRVDA